MSLPRPGPRKKPRIRANYSPPSEPIRRIKRTYPKTRKVEVLLFLENHRIPVSADHIDNPTQVLEGVGPVEEGFRRPYLKEAVLYFGIKNVSTIQYWWSKRDSIFGERVPRYRPRWPALEAKLYEEFLDARNARRLVHGSWFRRRAKALFADLYPRCTDIFVFSNGWFRGFLRRHQICRRRITHASTRVPAEIVKYTNEFLQFIRRNSRNEGHRDQTWKNTFLMSDPIDGLSFQRFPLHLIANLDETPMPFEFLEGYTYDTKGSRSVLGKSDRSGWGKRQATLILTILGDGSYAEELKPVIVFHGKGNVLSKEGVAYNPGVDVRFNETAYNNEALFEEWIWTKLGAYTERKESLLVIDVVSFHKTPAIQTALKDNNITVAMVPPGLTGYLQPLDVGFNGPFKRWLREETDLYLDRLDQSGTMPTKWTTSQRRIMTTHVVANAWQRAFSPANMTMVSGIFKKTGISIHPDGREDNLISIKGIAHSQLRLNDWYRPPSVRQDYDISEALATLDANDDEFVSTVEALRLPPNNYRTLTCNGLRDLCRQRGLRVSGIKRELVSRLEDDDAARQVSQSTQHNHRDQGDCENLQESSQEAGNAGEGETEAADLVHPATQAAAQEISSSASNIEGAAIER